MILKRLHLHEGPWLFGRAVGVPVSAVGVEYTTMGMPILILKVRRVFFNYLYAFRGMHFNTIILFIQFIELIGLLIELYFIKIIFGTV